MEIKTKFNINDEVYFLEDNKVEQGRIVYIAAWTNKNLKTVVGYNISLSNQEQDSIVERKENEIFSTKQELLESL